MNIIEEQQIERQTDSIKQQYRTEVQRLIRQLNEDINCVHDERRDAMFKEMEKLKESWSDDQ